MASPKTQPTSEPVSEFLQRIAHDQQRVDAIALDALLSDATGEPGVMWGSSIVGYGTTTITYADGRTAEWMAIGFSPRSGKFALYGFTGSTKAAALLDQLGKHSTGKSCLYVRSLVDVDTDVLRKLAAAATG